MGGHGPPPPGPTALPAAASPPLPLWYVLVLTLSQTKDLFFARILHTDEIPFLFNGMQRVKQKLTYTLYYASQWTFFVWKILSMEFRSLCHAPTTEFQFRLELCVVKTPRFKLNLKPQNMSVHEFSVYVSIGMNFNSQVFTKYVVKYFLCRMQFRWPLFSRHALTNCFKMASLRFDNLLLIRSFEKNF